MVDYYIMQLNHLPFDCPQNQVLARKFEFEQPKEYPKRMGDM